MKKNLLKISTICLLCFGISVSSQSKVRIGLDAGYTYNVMHANLSNLVDSKYSGRYGFGMNLSGEYMIWKPFFVSTGVSYLQKNYKFERTGSRAGWYTDYQNSFLNFPLLAGVYILNNPHEKDGLWIKLAGGMYTEYWLQMKREGQYPVFSELQLDGNFNYTKVSDTYDFKKNENELNRWGYGLHGQAQLGYSFGKLGAYAAYNYQYSLSDISKVNDDKEKKMSTRSYMLSLGISYKFD
ncbi:outer membrane beta-barrel protein [Elizabethkingia meningoseptica]|uniref:outer membrane beta-barrel protein n=1 Tax=Elizabethkingia meningoseptica TaxID=238 RepID=UPI002011F694|nr:outer membrane beta-barrel protein [Elizabethkingia meningoseptica]MCL1676179.1 PorT family protein [Elizabethkingia meningoseptica]MCL1684888.1 PorT family protein [Elizabethkingia meningoseptica]